MHSRHIPLRCDHRAESPLVEHCVVCIEGVHDQSFLETFVFLQGARIGVMRQVINTNTADADVMALFGNALTMLQQQGDLLALGQSHGPVK